MKHCFKCNQNKEINQFPKNKNLCKSCYCLGMKQWRLKNPEKQKDIATRRYLKNKEKLNIRAVVYRKKNPKIKKLTQANYRGRYPQKYKAHGVVSSRIGSGKLFKEPCKICGYDKKVEAHHDDYLKPLEITWLCIPHHKAWHRIFEAINP